jgi:hypothetical protein
MLFTCPVGVTIQTDKRPPGVAVENGISVGAGGRRSPTASSTAPHPDTSRSKIESKMNNDFFMARSINEKTE